MKSLERIKQENSEAGRPFTPSNMIWRSCCNVIAHTFRVEGLDIVEKQSYQNYFSARPPGHSCYDQYVAHMQHMIRSGVAINDCVGSSTNYELACQLLYAYVSKNDTNGLLDKTSSTNVNVVSINNHDVSWDYLMSVYTCNVVFNNLPHLLSDTCVVADLGPGWGRIGHVLKQANPKLTYAVFDLPEPLMVSRHRLPQLFPNERVLDYDFFANNNVITKDMLVEKPSLCFAGSHQLLKLAPKSIDLLININSMQEMDDGDAELYFDVFNGRVENLYVFAHESPFPGQGKGARKFSDYAWPKHWTQLFYKQAGTNFYWRDFFEVIFECSQ